MLDHCRLLSDDSPSSFLKFDEPRVTWKCPSFMYLSNRSLEAGSGLPALPGKQSPERDCDPILLIQFFPRALVPYPSIRIKYHWPDTNTFTPVQCQSSKDVEAWSGRYSSPYVKSSGRRRDDSRAASSSFKVSPRLSISPRLFPRVGYRFVPGLRAR